MIFRILALCEIRLLAQNWVSDSTRRELSNACACSVWWDSYVDNQWSGRFVSKHEIDNMLQELKKYKTYYDLLDLSKLQHSPGDVEE